MEDIKSFLLTSEDIAALEQQKKNSSKMMKYAYSVEMFTDTDIIIRKEDETSQNIIKLVLLASKNQYCILNNAGKAKVLTKGSIKNFFDQYQGDVLNTGHPIWDVFYMNECSRESAEQALLLMTKSKSSYTNSANSFIPLSHCFEIVQYERQHSHLKDIEKIFEDRLLILNSEIGQYVICKMMENQNKTKREVVQMFCQGNTVDSYLSMKQKYRLSSCSIEQIQCFYDIQRIWPDSAKQFVDKWIVSKDCSLSSSCIAHVLFAIYSDNIQYFYKTYGKCSEIDDYLCEQRELVYPFNREADKFIDFLFEESKKYYMNDLLIEWCKLWGQDLNIQKELYGEIVNPYPENLLVHVSKMNYLSREKTHV